MSLRTFARVVGQIEIDRRMRYQDVQLAGFHSDRRWTLNDVSRMVLVKWRVHA